MNKEQLDSLQKELKISIDKIIREEAEILFLTELADNNLGNKVAFYGGTALRLVYDSPRFSEDIDLIALENIEFTEFQNLIQQISKKHNWMLSDIKNKRQTIFALFKIKNENLKHPFSLKIEIHKPKNKINLETELRLIKSPTTIFAPLLLVPNLEELKIMKEVAINDRQKARDIFDLWYISQLLKINFKLPKKTPLFKKRGFENELKVFLPPKYQPIISQLYEHLVRKNK